ncbi:MAG: N-acetylglucosamine-6-phosphate deacetylase [Actinomycetota bacterium]
MSDHLDRAVVIQGGDVLTPDGLAAGELVMERGLISAIGSSDTVVDGVFLDAAGLFVVPGFVDVQINGAFGHDFTQDPSSIWEVGERLPEHGVTSFLPTVITSPDTTISRAQDVLAEGPPDGYLGANPIGLHLEGPFLSPLQPGTHDKRYLREPGEVDTSTWTPDRGVRMVTLAPELPGALELIETLVGRGVVVSLGHSAASLEEAVAGFETGATVGTHLYNAMSGFQHRDPGLVGALFTEADVIAEIIVDGIHSHPSAVRVAWDAKGPDHLVLITDAMAAMGMGHGRFAISSVDVEVDETGPRNADGVLAGSALRMDEAVRNLQLFARCSLEEAIGAATSNPASAIGEPDVGVIRPGARADVVLLDADAEVVATFVGGRLAHNLEDKSIPSFRSSPGD